LELGGRKILRPGRVAEQPGERAGAAGGVGHDVPFLTRLYPQCCGYVYISTNLHILQHLPACKHLPDRGTIYTI
jgi:hypothetical protein